MFKRSSIIVSLLASAVLPVTAFAEVRLPKVFGSHMVLQAGKPVTVWGWAAPGENVTVTLGGQSAKATATDGGEFRLALPEMKASATPITMTVAGTNTLAFDDVLVGEVWLCSGQSNMEMGVGVSAHATEEIAAADHPMIRLLTVPKKVAAQPQADFEGKWQVCSPQTAGEGGWGGFSATAYYFGRELSRELKVPIGLIHSSWGGTRIEPWTPPEGFAGVPSLKAIDESQQLANPSTPLHKTKLNAYLAELEAWVVATRAGEATGKEIAPMPKFPEALNFRADPQTPTGLYNGMIHPLIPFSIRGAIWYQGESNHNDGTAYIDKTRALVQGWRKLWNAEGKGEFPYYFVQIAPFEYGTEPARILAEFWEAQAAIPAVLTDSEMVVTNDISELKDIHPHNKQEVGRRLALLALNKTYGRDDVEASGPVLKGLSADGPRLKVTFDHAAGLTSRDGKPLTCFEIIDADNGGFVPATAEISGDTVALKADGVGKPVAVRFAWSKLAEPNLTNSAGLPASAFRAGEVPKRDALSMNVAEAKDYTLVYDLDLNNLMPINYTTDSHSTVTGTIDRIAYFMELGGAADNAQFVWVSMDAFTQDASKIGVPTAASGASFQQGLTNLTIISNADSVANGSGLAGNIEFWPNNYGSENSAKVPGASGGTYDFGDQKADPVDGHGSMQIHNTGAKQTVFALNKWRAGSGADLGIGNQPKDNPDWTFAGNAGSYSMKRLRVFVKVK